MRVAERIAAAMRWLDRCKVIDLGIKDGKDEITYSYVKGEGYRTVINYADGSKTVSMPVPGTVRACRDPEHDPGWIIASVTDGLVFMARAGKQTVIVAAPGPPRVVGVVDAIGEASVVDDPDIERWESMFGEVIRRVLRSGEE